MNYVDRNTAVVKLEIGVNGRIHCSTTAFKTVKKLMEGQVENNSYPILIQ